MMKEKQQVKKAVAAACGFRDRKRTARINFLRNAIRQGTYHTPASRVASRILTRHLLWIALSKEGKGHEN